jgi:DNA-binding beta-propeller fold protein YncE
MIKCTVLALGVASLFVATEGVLAQDAQAPYADFRGRAIVSISDGDMKASAYVNGQLGPAVASDSLTVTQLTPNLARLTSVSIPVSNSVAGPPTAVALTRDGKWAFVTEAFAARPPGAERFGQLQIGSKLTAVDLSDLTAPKIAGAVDIGKRPEGVSVNPAGDLIAVALHPADGRQLAFAAFENGRFGAAQYVTPPTLATTARVSHIEWHPSGEFVALTLVDEAQVAFARVEKIDGKVKLTEWGNRVLTSKYPYMGRFTPDGRHFLTSNLYWGPDVPGFWTEAVAGDVTTIRFAATPAPVAGGEPQVRHFLVGRAGTGKDPEGIAISPSGRYVVTTNLETSYAPSSDRRITPYSSLSLLRLNPETGGLTHLDTLRYDGILPEAATFDASGRYLAVVTYDQFDPSESGANSGALDFFRITEDDKLVQLRRSQPLPRGPHSMGLIN